MNIENKNFNNTVVDRNERFEDIVLLKLMNENRVNCSKSTTISDNEKQTLNNSTLEKKHFEPSHSITGQNPTSYWDTLTHMIKGNIGCGLLATGMAFKNGGLIVSSILVVILGLMTCYNQYILVVMANKFKVEHKLETIGFAETVGNAFEKGHPIFKKSAKFARLSIKMFIITTQLGFCCVYFLFITESLEQVLNCYDIEIDLHILMILVLPIIWATALIRELKYIAPLSTFANLSTFAAISLILYFTIDFKSISERKLIGNWDEIPLCFGTIVYSLEGIGLVLPLQQNMKKPKKFLGCFGVLNLSLIFVTKIMMTVGFFGYSKYGDNVRASLTYNLTAKDNVLTQTIIIFMTIGILFTYALQFFVPVLLLLPAIEQRVSTWPYREYHIYEYLLRSALVLLTFLIAELIPHLDLFVSLVGAVGGTFLALIYAPLADISRRHKDEYGIFSWRIIIACFSLIIGFCGFAVGTTISLREVIAALKK